MAEGSITYTPIQQRILALLSDGMPHDRWDVLKCIGDSLATLPTLHQHLYLLRLRLRMINQEILCERRQGRYMYRHVKLLVPIAPSADPI